MPSAIKHVIVPACNHKCIKALFCNLFKRTRLQWTRSCFSGSFMTYVSWRCWCFCHHIASVSLVVLKALRGEEWLCDRSFMVITLSRSSGQETSECNGSAGSPQYGFMKVQGWRGGSVTCFCFLQTPMNNVRELIRATSFWQTIHRDCFWQLLLIHKVYSSSTSGGTFWSFGLKIFNFKVV